MDAKGGVWMVGIFRGMISGMFSFFLKMRGFKGGGSWIWLMMAQAHCGIARCDGGDT